MYALFGIFNVCIPLLYGEGSENARKRLEEVIAKGNAYIADLRLTDPRDDKDRIADTKGGLFRGPSDWVLDHADFRQWHDTHEARLLWVKGDPGKGKTMLLITIVEELERQLERRRRTASSLTALSYFFCQGTDGKLNNATAVLRGLIYLLCIQQPLLASHLRARYDHAGTNLFQDANSFYVLSGILKSMIQDERLQKVYLIVDALDECIAERDQLLRFIARCAAISPRVKWIVSSRNVTDIENLLEINGSEVKLSLEVTQNAEQVARAVEAFIDHKLSNIRSLRDEHNMMRRVRDAMREKANGTFLWVALVARELEKAQSWRALGLVEKMPATLDLFYDLMMNRAQQSEEGEWEYCQLVLSTATLAYRPLHLAELAIISGLPVDIFKAHTNRIREVVDLCGSFLTVKDSIVYLIHQSVKDYLSGRAAATVFPSGVSQVHRSIFTQSIQALSTRLRRNMYGLPYLGVPINDIRVPKPDPLAGAHYSCIHWARHFCDACPGRNSFEREDLKRIEGFIRSSFLYWLEAVALLRNASESIVSIRRLRTFLEVRGLVKLPGRY